MAGAVEPAVDWAGQVAALQGSSEWRELLADLAAAPGGLSVAALLRRAAGAAAAAAAGARSSAAGSGGTSSGGSGGTSAGLCRLAEAVQQVAWEKLHSGDWHTVAVVWRDAYAAACILAAAAGLPGSGEVSGGDQQSGRDGQDSAAPAAEAGPAQAAGQGAAAAEASALAAALWHLDMAAIMGGPLLRLLVELLIQRLQRRWQQLHGAAACRPPGKQQAEAQAAIEGVEGGGEQPAKRQRRGGGSRVASAAASAAGGGWAAETAAAAAVRAADAVLLPPGSLGPRGTPVATAELPSLEAFWRDYMSTDTPVVISGAMEDWPALARWCDPAYLIAVAGPRTVPVEVGEHYLAEGWGQQLMTLQQFVERHIAPGAESGTGRSGSPGAGRGQQGQIAAAVGGQEQQPQDDQQEGQHQPQEQQQQPPQAEPAAGRGYLAQHPLFDQIPALAADIREPPYCVLGEGEVQSINAWFGPPGTVTPLHTDPHPNLLCQAAGRKYVRLYSPAHTEAMYPHAEGMHTNTGQVDVDAPDHQCHPLFAAAPFQDCVLEPGQMLFIPPGWWHYVKSTTVSFSVSFWWR